MLPVANTSCFCFCSCVYQILRQQQAFNTLLASCLEDDMEVARDSASGLFYCTPRQSLSVRCLLLQKMAKVTLQELLEHG